MNVTKMLLMGNVDVNEVDSEGNTALHWCLSGISRTQEPRCLFRKSTLLTITFKVTCSCHFWMPLNHLLFLYRIVWLLLKNGARVFQGNKLGLSPVHSAAAKGNYKALQVYFVTSVNEMNLMTLSWTN